MSIIIQSESHRKIMQIYIWEDPWEDYNLHTKGKCDIRASIVLKQRPPA